MAGLFHNAMNANDTLFGGLALQWMDEVAYISATRFTRQSMHTVSMDAMKFLKPVPAGSLVEVVGRVQKAGAMKLVVHVVINMERISADGHETVIEADFTMAALNASLKPRRLVQYEA